MVLPHQNQRSGVVGLLRLARNGQKSDWSETEMSPNNNRGQFKSEEFVKFCRECGIRREYTTPYNPEHNRIVERMNRMIQERVVYMLQHSGPSDGFWADALRTTIHIINMSPSRPLGLQIPEDIWNGSKPNYDKLRIFGCEAYTLIPKDALVPMTLV